MMELDQSAGRQVMQAQDEDIIEATANTCKREADGSIN